MQSMHNVPVLKLCEKMAKEAAERSLLIRAEEQPVPFMAGIIKAPYLLKGVKEVDELMKILLRGGQQEGLLLLQQHRACPPKVRAILSEMLLTALCGE